MSEPASDDPVLRHARLAPGGVEPASAPFDFRRAVTAIAAAHGMGYAEIMERSRAQRIVRARWDAFALLHARGWSLPQIAMHWRMDHTTVLYGLRERMKLLAESAEVRADG